MPPKDFVPPKIYAKMSDGAVIELDNDKPISEITELFEKYELVRVVRCKYCKWWDAEYQQCKLMEEQRTMGWDVFDKRTKPDWYCADGERKNEH